MNKDREADDLERLLDKALVEVLKPSISEETRARISCRRWFGIGMLCLAPACFTIAALPIPGKLLADVLMWVMFGLIYLFVGGWSIDKARREEVEVAKELDAEREAVVPTGIRRVK